MSLIFSEITSRKNDKIIWASKLADKKNRDREGVFFTEGAKLLKEALLSKLKIDKLFFTKKALEQYESLLADALAEESYLVTDEVYERLTDETAPQGIFACVRKPATDTFSDGELKNGGFIILEDIQNPLNLGAILRCSYSLGGTKLVLTRSCADIYGPKTLRSAMGCAFKACFYICDSIVDFIEEQKTLGNNVYCTHLHSDSLLLGTFDFNPGDSIVIGNEGHGVSDDVLRVCTHSVIIPMTKDAESLNAATASSILIWEMNKSKLIP